jgi:hypothetical protein
MDLLARTAVFYITDLETFNHFKESIAELSTPLYSIRAMLARITRLSIALRLPLAFYRAVEVRQDTTILAPELQRSITT